MTYRIDVSEAAEAEIDAAYLWLSRRSPHKAGQWHTGLLQAIESLGEMPRRCALAREHACFDEEVRQLLYGKGRSVFRILFVVRDGDGSEEASVRILHIRHGAQQDYGAEG